MRAGLWLAGISLGLLMATSSRAADTQDAPAVSARQSHAEYSKLSTNGDGSTSWTTEKLEWQKWFGTSRKTSMMPVNVLQFYHLSRDLDLDLHPAPVKQFLVILQGTLQIEASDGETRQFKPGSVVLLTDNENNTRGHKTKVIGEQDVVAAVVPRLR